MEFRLNNRTGFTLIEMLTILILLGILSAVAVSRLNLGLFRTESFEQELRSTIRFAQKFAIVSGCDVQLSVIDVTDSYAVNLRADAITNGCLDANSPSFTTPLNNPVGGVFAGTAPAGVNLGPDTVFTFDRQGRPSAAQNISVGTETIIVGPGTGYVR